jgi:hypothetical protein
VLRWPRLLLQLQLLLVNLLPVCAVLFAAGRQPAVLTAWHSSQMCNRLQALPALHGVGCCKLGSASASAPGQQQQQRGDT